MKKKSLDEIDENFKELLESEVYLLKNKLSDFNKREKNSEHEKEFKKKLTELLKKREYEIKNFLIKNKKNLFESQDEKKKVTEEVKGHLNVRHLNLSLNKREHFIIKKKLLLFKLNLKIKNFYYSIIPLFVIFHFFKLKFIIKRLFQDLFRKIKFIFNRIDRKRVACGKRISEFFREIYLKLLSFFKKILALFKKNKKEVEKDFSDESEEKLSVKEDDSKESEDDFSEKKAE